MRITEVEVIVAGPVSGGPNWTVVKIVTDQPGLVGYGNGAMSGGEQAVATMIEQHLAPRLIGADPDRIEDTWQLFQRSTYWRAGRVLAGATAAIDLALWDIKGKRAGLPLYSLLGGKCRDRVLCYGHASGRTIDDAVESVHAHRARGFRAIRAQVATPGYESGSYGAGGGRAETPGEPEPPRAARRRLGADPLPAGRPPAVRPTARRAGRPGGAAARRPRPPDADSGGAARPGAGAPPPLLPRGPHSGGEQGGAAPAAGPHHHPHRHRRALQLQVRLPPPDHRRADRLRAQRHEQERRADRAAQDRHHRRALPGEDRVPVPDRRRAAGLRRLRAPRPGHPATSASRRTPTSRTRCGPSSAACRSSRTATTRRASAPDWGSRWTRRPSTRQPYRPFFFPVIRREDGSIQDP